MNQNITGQLLDHIKKSTALLLWENSAVKISPDEPFKLASGNFSPIYVNCRQVISDPVFMAMFTAYGRLTCRLGRVMPDVIAGGETAGMPFGAYLAQAMNLPFTYVRKAKKDYGIANLVEGCDVTGKLVLLIEDLVTDGGSKIHFIEAIRAAGGEIEDILVLFDRKQGGRKMLEKVGVKLHAMTDLRISLEIGVETELLTQDQVDSVVAYLENPGEWHKKMGLAYCE